MQCHLTKYLVATPLTNMSATTVADALARDLMCQFGAPRAILSDNAKNFIAEVIQELFHILKIRHNLETTNHPETNGQIKRSHACIKDFLRCYSEKLADWDRLVPFAIFTYNTSVHSATNYTPFELVYGRIVRFPIKIPAPHKLPTYNVYIQDLVTRLNDMHIDAGKNIIRTKIKRKKQYDRRLRNFRPKDYYDEPVQVVEVLSSKNVLIKDADGVVIRKHIDKLLPAKLRENGYWE